MNPLSKFLRSCQRYGFGATWRRGIGRLLGTERQQEEIDTLFYFLNTFFTPMQVGAATDQDLRIMQLCDAALINVLHQLFAKHHLTYWLEFGTLLGAVRHHGFIPWDDDTDIAMPRDDYNRALALLPAALERYGITAQEDAHYPMARIGVGYKHEQTGIWVDIFPVDEYPTDDLSPSSQDDLKRRIAKYKRYYSSHHDAPIATIQAKKRALLGGDTAAKTALLYHGQEFNHSIITAFPPDQVFPLQQITFEGYAFNAPCQLDKHLTMIYSPRYMQFPRTGAEHHDLGRGPLKTWAKRNNIDMQEVLNYLSSIVISD